MDATLAIEHDRQALRRIVAGLAAKASMADGRLPRHLRNAVLRLLRPAEAAARRLVIALSRGLAVPPAMPKKRPDTARRPTKIPSRGLTTSIVWPAGMAPQESAPPQLPHTLPLFDPLRKPFARRHIPVPAHLMPRISAPGVADARPFTPPPSQDDPCDARRLGLRLDALAAALDDLPGQALRFARWQARHGHGRQRGAWGNDGGAPAPAGPNANRSQRVPRRWPLRPGRPPGLRKRGRDEVHDILAHAHELAVWALKQPDTS